MLPLAHLGAVLALVVTLPCRRFVHGLYRLVAPVKDTTERAWGSSV